MFKALLEYRGHSVEKREYVSKRTGQTESFVDLVLHFEGPSGQPVSVRPQGVRLTSAEWACPYVRGQFYEIFVPPPWDGKPVTAHVGTRHAEPAAAGESRNTSGRK